MHENSSIPTEDVLMGHTLLRGSILDLGVLSLIFVEHGAYGVASSEATRVGQFMRLNRPTFTSVKVEEDPQGFLDEMENIFRVMKAICSEIVRLLRLLRERLRNPCELITVMY
ncbi:hypothetical protein P3S68_015675 [Capsicum galapagoense]